MNPILKTIIQRRVVKLFDPVDISPELREEIWTQPVTPRRASTLSRTGLLGAVRGEEGRSSQTVSRTEASGNGLCA
jgi:hypothetical protein